MKTMKTPGFLSSVSPSSKSLSLRVVLGSFHTTVMCANNIYGVKQKTYLWRSEMTSELSWSYCLSPKEK